MLLRASLAVSTILLTSTAFAQQQGTTAGSASTQAAQLQVTQRTEVPGFTLSPGAYAIRVEDQLHDRVIVQVRKKGSNTGASLLAYPNPDLRGGTFTGPVTFVTGLKGKPTLRGYAFPGGPTVEFIYPKKDAVELAKANSVRVMAVDPTSEGRVALPHLTQNDMSEVTLWMLTPTPVDPTTAKPGIAAARYQPPVTQAQTQPQPSPAPQPSAPAAETASSAPAQSSYAPAQPSTPPPSSHASVRPAPRAPVQVASNTHPHIRPNVQQLPHTASNLPLISLVGCLSFASALLLSLRRRLFGSQA